jgi:hypothetical protein
VLCFWGIQGNNPVFGLHAKTVVTNLMESAFDVNNFELTSSWKDAPSLRSVTKIGGRFPSFSLQGKANVQMPALVFHSLLGRLELLLALFIQGVSQIYFWT